MDDSRSVDDNLHDRLKVRLEFVITAELGEEYELVERQKDTQVFAFRLIVHRENIAGHRDHRLADFILDVGNLQRDIPYRRKEIGMQIEERVVDRHVEDQ